MMLPRSLALKCAAICAYATLVAMPVLAWQDGLCYCQEDGTGSETDSDSPYAYYYADGYYDFCDACDCTEVGQATCATNYGPGTSDCLTEGVVGCIKSTGEGGWNCCQHTNVCLDEHDECAGEDSEQCCGADGLSCVQTEANIYHCKGDSWGNDCLGYNEECTSGSDCCGDDSTTFVCQVYFNSAVDSTTKYCKPPSK